MTGRDTTATFIYPTLLNSSMDQKIAVCNGPGLKSRMPLSQRWYIYMKIVDSAPTSSRQLRDWESGRHGLLLKHLFTIYGKGQFGQTTLKSVPNHPL